MDGGDAGQQTFFSGGSAIGALVAASLWRRRCRRGIPKMCRSPPFSIGPAVGLVDSPPDTKRAADRLLVQPAATTTARAERSENCRTNGGDDRSSAIAKARSCRRRRCRQTRFAQFRQANRRDKEQKAKPTFVDMSTSGSRLTDWLAAANEHVATQTRTPERWCSWHQAATTNRRYRCGSSSSCATTRAEKRNMEEEKGARLRERRMAGARLIPAPARRPPFRVAQPVGRCGDSTLCAAVARRPATTTSRQAASDEPRTAVVVVDAKRRVPRLASSLLVIVATTTAA